MKKYFVPKDKNSTLAYLLKDGLNCELFSKREKVASFSFLSEEALNKYLFEAGFVLDSPGKALSRFEKPFPRYFSWQNPKAFGNCAYVVCYNDKENDLFMRSGKVDLLAKNINSLIHCLNNCHDGS